MNLIPLYSKVILKVEEPETKTLSGIFLPDNADTKSYIAKVIAVGQGTTNEKGELTPLPISVDQRVLISGSWAGDNVTVEGIEYKIVDAKDILAIIE